MPQKRKPSVRIEFETDDERNQRHAEAKADGLKLIPWIKWKCGWTEKPKKQVRTKKQEAIETQFDDHKSIYEGVKVDIKDREEKESVLIAIQILAKYLIKKRNDR